MEIVNYLNSTVYCRLAASAIHNVGVFAIRDIKEGQKLTDYRGGEFPCFYLTEEEFRLLHREIQDLIQQQTIFEKGELLRFDSPNSHQILEVFMNHSAQPNSDGQVALCNIKKGEEITKNYHTFLNTTHPKTTYIFTV